MRKHLGLYWRNFGANEIILVAAAATCLLLLAGNSVAQQSHSTWSDYLGNEDSSHYSSLTQIDRSNVRRLEIAWKYPTGDRLAYAANPIIAGNLMYVFAKNNSIVALDATNGKEVWTFETGEARGRHRGLNYWESKDRSDRRILAPLSNQLTALDARTGKLIESFGKQGKVDLRAGLGRDPNTIHQIQSNTPGRIFENLIILGSATGESYLSPPGDLRAYDVISGKMVWIFHTVPHPGEFGYDTWPKDAWKYVGGTNTWGEISIDEKRGIAYFPLGSPTYDFYGADRKGANLFSDCILALDARTGKYIWHYQLVHHDLWDYDPTAAPQLIIVQHDGTSVDAVAVAGKQGFLYVFDRVSGKPLWPIEEHAVPRSDMKGEQAAATQPYPTVLPPFARQKFTIDDIDNFFLTPEEQAKWRDALLSARNEGLYTPPGLKATIEMPGNHGGANWGNTASDPSTGTVYVLSMDIPAVLKLSKTAPIITSARDRSALPGQQTSPAEQGSALYSQSCAVCHGPELKGSGAAPSLIGVVARLGDKGVRAMLNTGGGEMPSFGNLAPAATDAILAFLSNPASAPAQSAPPRSVAQSVTPPTAASARAYTPPPELPYPSGVDVPADRYYTGYGLFTTAIKPPWSSLTAYDLNAGTIKWKIPFGDAPGAGSAVTNRGVLMERNGVVVTAGGLIFAATNNEGKLRAYDKDTGKELWVYDLPAGSEGVLSVYEAGGREYLVVPASSNKGAATPNSSGIFEASNGDFERGYIAFALPRETTSSK